MKGKNKIIVPLLLAGMATTSVVSNVETQQVALANTPEVKIPVNNMYGVELGVIGGFSDTYSFGSSVTMPAVKTNLDSDEGTVQYEVVNGEEVVWTKTVTKAEMVEGYNTALTFKPQYTGRYLVKITASESGRVSSTISNLYFSVVRTGASIILPANSKHVIPEIISGSEELKVPFPTVTKEVDGEDKEMSVAQLGAEFTAKLITPTETLTLVKNTTENCFELKAEDKEKLKTPGTHKILFEYRDSADPVTSVRLAYLEKTFQVSKNYEAPTSLVIKLSAEPSTSGVVGTDISLPRATVYAQDKTTQVNAHIRVWYTHLESGEKKELTAEQVENSTFKPTKIGSYIFAYQADIPLYNGLTSELHNPTKIMKVYDTKAPTVIATSDYEVDGNGNIVSFNNKGNLVADMDSDLEGLDLYAKIGELMENRDHEITSIAVRKDNKCILTLPAIYAYDNNDGYSDLTLKREIVGNGITRVVVEDLINPLTNEKYKPNETATIEFTPGEGNYTIRYYAEDKAVNKDDTSKTKPNSSSKTPALVVKDSAISGVEDQIKKGKTTITLKIARSSVSKNDTFAFEAPTVKDTHDSLCQVKVGYILYSDVDAKSPITTDPIFVDKNESSKYELDMADVLEGFTSAKAMRVVVYATVDSSLADYRDLTTIEQSKIIKISDTATDDVWAPTLVNLTNAKEWNDALLLLNNGTESVEGSVDITTPSDRKIVGIDDAGYALVYKEGSNTETERLTNKKGTELAAFDQCTTNLTSQKNILQLPSVQISDKNKLSLSVTVQDKDGNIIPLHTQMSYESLIPTVVDEGTVDEKYVYDITGVSFMLTSSGVYTITYKAEDSQGNVMVKTFGVRVNDKTPPSIIVEEEEKFGNDIQVGEFFEIPYRYLIKDKVADVDEVVYWELYDQPDNIEVQPVKTEDGFTAYAPGTYYIRFYGYDDYMNLQMLQDDTKYFVNVVDTKAPEFNKDSEHILPSHMAWEEDTKSLDVEIPLLRATDNDVTCSPKVSCTVTGPNGSSVTVSNSSDDTLKFTATKQGIYTIKYETTDKSGNSTTHTEEIKIGDYTAPTIEWKNESTNLSKTLNLNKEGKAYLTFDTTNIIFEDVESEFADMEIDYKVVKDGSSTKLDNIGTKEVHKYELTETGSYKLTITAKDEAGNKTTKDYTITVPAENLDKDEVSPVVGTVLVVVAVVILAGVVVYFVVSSRKKSGKAARPAKKSKK